MPLLETASDAVGHDYAQRQQPYCAYSDFSELLRLSGEEHVLAMWRVFFDDSGTDGTCDIAVAACYVSTQRSWDEFVKEWDIIREEEGFDAFHMAEFVARPDQRHEPFCHWDKAKKDRVYARIAEVINKHKRIGIAAAVPKKIYDAVVPEPIRAEHGKQHYTMAIRQCLTRIKAWRESRGITMPMEYVFDFEMRHSEKRKEIETMWRELDSSWSRLYGMEPDGYSFRSRKRFKPLQAADVLAWQMRSHMRKIFDYGHDVVEKSHAGFTMLRMDQEMDLGFFTEAQLRKWVRDIEALEPRL